MIMGDKYPYYIVVTFGFDESYIILDTSTDGKYTFSKKNVCEHTDFAFAHLEDAVEEVKHIANAYPDFAQITIENAKVHKWERIFEHKDNKIIGIYKLGNNEYSYEIKAN